MSAFDIAVVGAGPAGIAAACRAAENGARVVVIDDNPAPGGQIWRGEKSEPWIERFKRSGAVLERDTAVDERVRQRGAKLILATGARELFLPFPGWTLPGVTGVGGLQALIKSGLAVKGMRVVIAGSGPLLLAAASLARSKGAVVRLVAEQAPGGRVTGFAGALWRHPGKALQGAELILTLIGVRYDAGCFVEEACGEGQVEHVRVRRGERAWEEKCDLLAVGFGLVPNTELAALLGCDLDSGFVRTGDWQQTSVPGVYAAGELTGIGGVEKSLVEGEIAGLAAAGREADAERLFSRRASWKRFAARLQSAFALEPVLKKLAREDTCVCRCEDVPLSELKGRASWREAKLQTRCGMGSCQGRICGAATREILGWGADSVRPPAFPTKVRNLIESKSS